MFVYSKSVTHKCRLMCQYDSLIKMILSVCTNSGFLQASINKPHLPEWLQTVPVNRT